MPHDRLQTVLTAALTRLDETGRRKGAETVITRVLRPSGSKGTCYLLKQMGETPFLRMNSNNYLGMSLHSEVIEAERLPLGHLELAPVRCASSAAPGRPTLNWSTGLLPFTGARLQ